MTTNGMTVYDKAIEVYREEYYGYEFTARAIPSINSQSYMSNILLCEANTLTCKNGEPSEDSIILSSDDCMEFCDHLMHVAKDSSKRNCYVDNVSTTLATGVKVEYIILSSQGEVTYFGHDFTETVDSAILSISDKINGEESQYNMYIPVSHIKAVCDCIMSAVSQALDMLECNRNLEKQMTTLKNDMKLEKVHELYFELYDAEPKMYSTSILDDKKFWSKTYKITARDENSNPLYAFLRNMHLTCVPMVDYRDYGKEFLCCPFIYSDEMIEIGKQFVAEREKDAHNTVNSKIENTTN